VVSNSGDLDGTFTYYYDALHRMIEARDGSDNLVTQVYSGTQYIDEVVSMKTDHGYMIVNQDANWNVVAAVDLGGTVLERVYYSPYGQPTFNSETFFGDYGERSERERAAIGKADMDVRVRPATCPQGVSRTRATEGGDGDVDSTDDGNLGQGQACWGADPSGACRVFDFDVDGDLDNDDQTVMTALVNLPSTNHVHHNRTSSSVGLIFAHQGLILDPEIGTYYNRARTYNPSLQRFIQTDPHGIQETTVDADLLYVDGLNNYAYVRNNPVLLGDSKGLACGDACTDEIVPDTPWGIKFTPCCEKHDLCYEKCETSRTGCDLAFLDCMLKVCKRTKKKLRCRYAAFTYYAAVALKGGCCYHCP